MMNILILVSSLNVGGAEKQAVNDANMLCVNNNVCLLVFADGILKNKLASKIKYKVIEKQGYMKTSKIISDFVTTNNIDIIHASLFAPMIISALSARKSRKPIIWNFHSHEYNIPLKSKLSFILFSRMKLVKKITYVNNELREFFEKSLMLPSKKGMILYNSTEFNPKKENKQNNDIIHIGYVGRLVELKRVHILLELAVFLKDNNFFNFCIEIYGDGDSRKELEKFRIEQELECVVVFHGFKTDLEDAYQSFDLFINPSREECLSVATIDAGIMGKPIIVFDVGGNDEIVIHNKTGFVINSKEELFQQAKELVLDAEKRLKFGENAMKHCESNFTEEIRKKKLSQCFLDACEN